MKIVFQIDNIKTLDIKSDTSLCLAAEALLRKFDVWLYTPEHLTYRENKLYANANKIISITSTTVNYDPIEKILLNDADILFIRQNPPFDMNYITYTYLLELLQNTLIVNNPSGIRNFTEKLSALMFPNIIPDTMVTSEPETALDFLKKHKSLVCKPLYGFGGHDIKKYDLEESDLFHINFKSLCNKYNTPIILQKFIPSVKNGDKRIILIDGEPVGVVRRKPQTGSIKSNLCAGGSAIKTSLTKQDILISKIVGKELVKHNIVFAGLDVIGEYLTEINVTSPTTIVTINDLYELKGNKRIEFIIWESILKKYKKR